MVKSINSIRRATCTNVLTNHDGICLALGSVLGFAVRERVAVVDSVAVGFDIASRCGIGRVMRGAFSVA